MVALPKSTFMVDGKLDEEVMQVGEVVPMSDDEGQEIVGVVVDVEAEFVHVDFNHPLAGLEPSGCSQNWDPSGEGSKPFISRMEA